MEKEGIITIIHSTFLFSLFVSVFLSFYFIFRGIKSFSAPIYLKNLKFYSTITLFLLSIQYQNKNSLATFIQYNLTLKEIDSAIFAKRLAQIFSLCVFWNFDSYWLIILLFIFSFFSNSFRFFQSYRFLLLSEVFRGLLDPFYQIVFVQFWVSNVAQRNSGGLDLRQFFTFYRLIIAFQFICSLINSHSDVLSKQVFTEHIISDSDYAILSFLSGIFFGILFRNKTNDISKPKSERFHTFYQKLRHLLHKIFSIQNPKFLFTFLYECFYDIYQAILIFRMHEIINFSLIIDIDRNFLSWTYLLSTLNGIHFISFLYLIDSRINKPTILIYVILLMEGILLIIFFNSTSIIIVYFSIFILGILEGILKPIHLIMYISNYPFDFLLPIRCIAYLFSLLISFGILKFCENANVKIYICFGIVILIAMNIISISMKLMN